MKSRFLFVVVETGAASYLAPLWRRWLTQGVGVEWKIIAAPSAATFLRKNFSHPPQVIEVSDQVADLEPWLNGWQPQRILCSAGAQYPLEHAARCYARTHSIRVNQFIDAPYNYRLRFPSQESDRLPDAILVADERISAEAAAEGVPKQLLAPLGHPAWESAKPMPAAPSKSVLFIGSPIATHYGRRLGYDEWDAWNAVRDAAILRRDLLEVLMYAPHPFQQEISEQTIEPAHLITNSAEGIARAGTVLGMFAMPMFDAFFAQRRVISIQPAAIGPDLCALSRWGHISRIDSATELIAALESSYKPSNGLTPASYAGSTERLTTFLTDGLT